MDQMKFGMLMQRNALELCQRAGRQEAAAQAEDAPPRSNTPMDMSQ